MLDCNLLGTKFESTGNFRDRDFDSLLPPTLRKLSRVQWTPADVAMRAATFLANDQNAKVLDVGSGAGKFCVIAGLTTSGKFVGIEQRPRLWRTACAMAKKLKVSNVHFRLGNMMDIDWTEFNGIYLFNPFYEHREKSVQIDKTLNYKNSNFIKYVQYVQMSLGTLKRGTRVAIYNGFGGSMPTGYKHVKREVTKRSALDYWVRE